MQTDNIIESKRSKVIKGREALECMKTKLVEDFFDKRKISWNDYMFYRTAISEIDRALWELGL